MEDDRSANRHRTRKLILRWTVAAAFLALLGTGAWWVIWNQKAQTPAIVATKPADVPAPTGSRATLTLASGQQIILDSASSGALVQQGNAQVVKGVGGQLSYRVEKVSNHELIYNTLTNPRGSQVVALTLSDGTRVWPNAESSIRYPVVFTGSDRRVEMTGEAYYELAKNARQPFSVEEKGMTIRVLGTSFNVNGYDDEQYFTTTLVEGKVEVNYENVGAILEPAMQAQVYRGPNPGNLVPAIKVGPADVARATV